MNAMSNIKAEVPSAAATIVLRSPYAIRYEVEAAARALERASIQLRAIPAFPECEELRAVYQTHYDECIADMRKAIENA